MIAAWRETIEKVHAAMGYPGAREISAAHDSLAWQKALTEASSWIVLLHGAKRTAAADRGVQYWLADNELNRAAMEHATQTWEEARGSVRESAKINVQVPEPRGRLSAATQVSQMWTVAASLLAAAVGLLLYLRSPDLSTRVGERQTVALEDGTEVILNTATRISIDYKTHQRHVRLLSGEAFFKVAKRPDWPFVVSVADREVTALGTEFLVRRDSKRFAVTLVEGRVAVNTVAQSVTAKASSMTPLLVLAPGERLTYSEGVRGPKLDRPVLEKLTAWQHGVINIDDMTLAEAVTELNRYSELKLIVEGKAADIRVGGVFSVTDSRALGRAVALTHGLDLREEHGLMIISGTPRPATEDRFDSGH